MAPRPSAPHILPTYKATAAATKPKNSCSLCINVCLLVVPLFLLFLFFMAIYMGTAFLSEHLEGDLQTQNTFNNPLPGTRNIIQKWSLAHLHGVDLTALGPPPLTSAQNLSSPRLALPQFSISHYLRKAPPPPATVPPTLSAQTD